MNIPRRAFMKTGFGPIEALPSSPLAALVIVTPPDHRVRRHRS